CTVSAWERPKDSPWVTTMPTISWFGTQERTQVLSPICGRTIWLPGPVVGLAAVGGSHFSCVPQPISHGEMDSSHMPSGLHVETNSSGDFALSARWLSHSLQWITFTPSS